MPGSKTAATNASTGSADGVFFGSTRSSVSRVPGDRRVRAPDLLGGCRRRLVAAKLGLSAQVTDHGVGHLRRWQRGARVVQVRHPGHPRRVQARPPDIKSHARNVSAPEPAVSQAEP